MRRHARRFAGSLFSIALLATNCPAQVPEQGTRVGEKVDSAVQSLKRGANNAGEAIREQYNKMRTSVHNMGVSSRIYGRLHWDKAVANAQIDVAVRQDGVATLTGSVPDARSKVKAVELTRDTVGVTQVIDRLAIAPPSTVTPVEPPAAAPQP